LISDQDPLHFYGRKRMRESITWNKTFYGVEKRKPAPDFESGAGSSC